MFKGRSKKYEQFSDEWDDEEATRLGLEPGDVMLKHAEYKNMMNVATLVTQALIHPRKGSSDIVHGAIYIGGGKMAEAQTKGLNINSLDANLKKRKYDVYRYVGQNSEGVIGHLLARIKHTRRQHPHYALWGAMSSPFRPHSTPSQDNEEEPLIGAEKSIFCSGSVVDWCNGAARDSCTPMPFYAQGETTTPQALAGFLTNSTLWKHVKMIGKGTENEVQLH